MYLIFACVVVVVFTVVLFSPRKYRLGASVFFGIIAAILGSVLGMFIDSYWPTEVVVSEPVELVAMHSSTGVSGAFLYGTGGFNGMSVYSLLYKNKDGSFSPAQVSANSAVRIVEDPNLKSTGYWQTTTKIDEPNWKYRYMVIHRYHFDEVVKQEFHVPVGSVVQGINIQ